jgi:hypothetical protein
MLQSSPPDGQPNQRRINVEKYKAEWHTNTPKLRRRPRIILNPSFHHPELTNRQPIARQGIRKTNVSLHFDIPVCPHLNRPSASLRQFDSHYNYPVLSAIFMLQSPTLYLLLTLSSCYPQHERPPSLTRFPTNPNYPTPHTVPLLTQCPVYCPWQSVSINVQCSGLFTVCCQHPTMYQQIMQQQQSANMRLT